MKKFVLALAAVAAFSGSAMAADMTTPVYKAAPPAMPAWNWSGFYIGANGGYGWADPSTTATYFGPLTGAGLPAIPNLAFRQSSSGPVFGGHVGYNYQFTNWLVGIEGDIDSAGINKSSQFINLDPLGGAGGTATDGLSASTQVQWLASIRGRLGYVSGPNLFYVTGGGAWESVNTKVLLSADTMPAIFSTSSAGNFTTTKGGWVAGLGYERMITPSWIVRAEYLHYGFQGTSTNALAVSCGFFGAGTVCGQNIGAGSNQVDVVRLGLSYKFGG
jgi:outer membrane immunogenic protein